MSSQPSISKARYCEVCDEIICGEPACSDILENWSVKLCLTCRGDFLEKVPGSYIYSIEDSIPNYLADYWVADSYLRLLREQLDAMNFHRLMCRKIHPDECTWFEEIENHQHDWNGEAHKTWLIPMTRIS